MRLVDADVWIDYFSGAQPGADAVEHLLRQGQGLLSVVSLFELLCGAQREEQLDQLETLQAAVEPIPLTAAMAATAAAEYRRLRRRGEPIGNEDLLLAATALELGVAIVTRNRRHFERVAGLELLDPAAVLAS